MSKIESCRSLMVISCIYYKSESILTVLNNCHAGTMIGFANDKIDHDMTMYLGTCEHIE